MIAILFDMKMLRKHFSNILLVLAAVLLISSTVLTLFVTPTMAQEIPREETLIVSDAWGPPPGWNPFFPEPAWGTQLMYPALFFYSTRDDVWIPYLAEGYRWVDKYTLEVKIRPEAKWWDGTPITAEDVVFTFELGKKYVIGWVTPYWDYLERVEAVDEKTVRFITSEEKLNYLQMLGLLQGVIIVPKHRWAPLEEELGEKMVTEFKDDDPSKIIGGGPYRLLTWSEEIWYYERVDDWWGKDIFGLPGPKYVAHKVFKDNVAAALGFEAGEVDACGHFFAKIYEMWEVKGLPVRTYYAHPPYYIGSGIINLYINYAKYPLSDPNVRRAIAYAIPYDDLVSKAYFNYSVRAAPVPIIHTIPSYARWINETLVKKYGFDYDLEKAKKILDDAGIVDRDGDGIREMPDGTKLGTFTISVPYGWTDWMMMCDMIATNLREIGIDVVTEFPDFSVWWDRLIKGRFDLVLSWDGGMGFDHPWNSFRWLMDPRLTGPIGEDYPAGNWERYTNWEVVPLIDAAARETDPEKLAKIYSQLQEMFLRDLPTIPLFYGAAWYEFRYDRWVGWPTEEDPRWASPYIWDWPRNLPMLFALAKAGEEPKVPSWIYDMRIPTSKIFEDLSAVLAVKKGILSIDTTPVKGEVFVNGKSWGKAPVTKEVEVGTYTITFGAVEGYDAPPPQTVTVEEGRTTTILGTYTKKVAVPKLEEVLGKLSDVSSKLEDVSSRLDTLSKGVDEVKSGVKAISDLSGALSDLRSEISNLRSGIEALRSDLSTISTIGYVNLILLIVVLVVAIMALRRPVMRRSGET